MTALRTVQLEKSTLSHRFLFTHRYVTDPQAPSPGTWYKTFSWLFGSHEHPLTRTDKSRLNTTRIQLERWRSLDCQIQHSWKSEAKEDHQVDLQQSKEFRSQLTDMNGFRSGPS